MRVLRARGAIVLLFALCATACSDARSFGFPVAVIEFEERPTEATSLEIALATAQESCIDARRAAGQPVQLRVARAEDLVVVRRSVRAHYDGERMAWHQIDRFHELDEESCALRLRQSRSVTVIDSRASRQWNSGPDGDVERTELPVLPADLARAPPSMPASAAIRTVAGQPCAQDETSTDVPAPFMREPCFWRTHPQIRDHTLQHVPLYGELVDQLTGNSSSVWRATRISVGERSLESAFELPPE